MEVTKEQFELYKDVQESGAFNMLDPRAIQAAGLDKVTYLTIIKNYDDLEDKYGSR